MERHLQMNNETDQMKKLENCNNIARMYGMRTGVKSFLDSIDGFLFSETGYNNKQL